MTTFAAIGSRFTRFFLPSRMRLEGRPSEAIRIERVIAAARLALIAIAFVGSELEPIAPAAYAPAAHALFVVFAAHALSAWLVLQVRGRATRAFRWTTHVIDLLLGAAMLPIAGSQTPFLAFFLFALVTASFRWGFRETFATTIAAVMLVLAHAWLAFRGLIIASGVDSEEVIMRVACLTMLGLLLGYLAEESRTLRAETAALANLLGKIRVHAGAARALTSVVAEIVALFEASRLLVVVEDLEGHRLFRWDTVAGWSVAPSTDRSRSGLDRDAYFFGHAEQSMALARRLPIFGRRRFRLTAIDASSEIVDGPRLTSLPDAFVQAHPFKRLIVAPVTFGDEWSGRIFVFNPQVDIRLAPLVQFLQMLVRHAGPAVFNVYLLGRLRARASAVERARVARELHDGVIQALLGVEMELHAIRARGEVRSTSLNAELGLVQHVVHTEITSLRELMQQMRPLELPPGELLDHLADLVQRFGRDTGIVARFASDTSEVRLPRRVCFEIVRIVQEALVNVRKHSAAKKVLVRFGFRDGDWQLDVDDDGQGFAFEGRLNQAELDARHAGPVIIQERVRAIGGQLTIESTRGSGSRLEVRVPQGARG